jgi:cell division protein ZapA
MLGGVSVEETLMKVTARILGEDYTIRGRMPQEHIERIARYVDGKMLQISEAYPKLGTSRVAVLAAINMADELFKIKEQYDHLTQLLEEEWSQRHQAASTREAPKEAPPREVAPRERYAGGMTGAKPANEETANREVAATEERHLFTGDALAPEPRGWPSAARGGPEPPVPSVPPSIGASSPAGDGDPLEDEDQ